MLSYKMDVNMYWGVLTVEHDIYFDICMGERAFDFQNEIKLPLWPRAIFHRPILSDSHVCVVILSVLWSHTELQPSEKV